MENKSQLPYVKFLLENYMGKIDILYNDLPDHIKRDIEEISNNLFEAGITSDSIKCEVERAEEIAYLLEMKYRCLVNLYEKDKLTHFKLQRVLCEQHHTRILGLLAEEMDHETVNGIQFENGEEAIAILGLFTINTRYKKRAEILYGTKETDFI